MIRAIVFDLGETLVDETRQWTMVAAASGVPVFTLMGVLGGMIERRESHRRMFDVLGIAPILFIDTGYRHEVSDFYPDALPALRRLSVAGYRLGIAGNQPDGVVEGLRALELPVELVASSALWGVEKPSLAFFSRIGQELALPAGEIAYVGDRLDNDVLPAQEAGMMGVFLRREPWGYLQAGWPEVAEVQHRIDDLTQLADVLSGLEPPTWVTVNVNGSMA